MSGSTKGERGSSENFPKEHAKPQSVCYQCVAQTFVCATFAPQTEKSGLSCCVTRLSNSIEGQQLYAPALSVLFREDFPMTP